jgi:hypothetical protein
MFLRPFGMLAKLEATYRDPATTLSPTADAVQLADRQDFAFDWLTDGARKTRSAVAPGSIARVPPTGRSGKGPAMFELQGKGSAYASASDFVPNLHPFLRAAGYSAAFSAGEWTFTPQPLGVMGASLALQLYGRGIVEVLRGVLTSLTIDAADTGPIAVTFDANGVAPSLPGDAVFPTLTYPAETQPPSVGQQCAVAIGAYTTAVVRSWKFTQGRSTDTARQNLNLATGHGGFAPGDSTPTLEITIESPTVSNWNAYGFHGNATPLGNVSITIGGAANSGTRCVLELPVAYLTTIAPGEDGEISLLTLTITPTSAGTVGAFSHRLRFS